MNFEEFWQELKELLTTTNDFQTADKQKPFVAKRGIESVIIMPESSNKKYEIDKDEFRTIWNLAKEQVLNGIYKPSNFQKNTYKSSYILTLMKEILNK